ncbi:chloramphenicol acetyltransferase [Parabacteroides sp. OttesenSCG-928-G07]|nr:chloramphenicol acetyltransferase [Parabacteroides sp. OttesenSCG-928-G21]MDL2278813.1 chloramphenicol acetyltransferase [Parabacteroides sp. OttesenSCG-928-G07]
MKHKIDLDKFERKHSVDFFSTFAVPFVTLTSEVECTGARQRAKQQGISFFLYYTHAMLKATNAIKEFKYRVGAGGKEIYLYDEIHALAIITTGNEGKYNTLFLPYHDDLLTFATEAQQRIDRLEAADDPFSNEQETLDNDRQDLLLISAVPTLSFTGVNFAQRGSMESYPLSLIGKMTLREGKEYLPIAITVNHAFVDGYHLSQFYEKVRENLFREAERRR